MKTTTTAPPHPERHNKRQQRQIQVHISWKLLLIKDARVHYVVLKQQPQTTHPTRTPKRGKTVCSLQPGNTETQVPDPAAYAADPGPVASGPNSVPNTKPPAPSPHRSRTTTRGRVSVLGAGKKPAAAIR